MLCFIVKGASEAIRGACTNLLYEKIIYISSFVFRANIYFIILFAKTILWKDWFYWNLLETWIISHTDIRSTMRYRRYAFYKHEIRDLLQRINKSDRMLD